MIQQTSIDAYIQAVRPNLNTKQQDVYMALKNLKVACNQDISEFMDLPINNITPRCLELRQKGLVVENHRDRHPETRRTVIYWTTAA